MELNENTKTNEVEDTQPVDNGNQSTQENVGKEPKEIEESKTIEDDDSEVVFDDSEEEQTADASETTKGNTNENQKKNSRNDNRRYAKLRKEAELEKQRSYFNGLKEGIGGKNPYTKSDIESDEDIQEYLYMKEMDAKGLDPTNSHEYNKFMRSKQQEIQAEKDAKEQSANKYREELSEFNKAYKDIDIENLIETDENWRNAIIPQIRAGISLKNAYESVAKLINNAVSKETSAKADELAKNQIQKSLATPNSQTDGYDNQVKKVDYLNMSDEEFRKEQERRRNGW